MNTPRLSIDRNDSGTAVVTLRGEHEAFSAPRLDRELGALLDEGYAIEIDLRETTFVDSSTVGVMLAAKRRAEETEADFTVHMGPGTGSPVRRRFEITGLAAFSVSD